MTLFLQRLDGKLVNISLVQTIYVDPEDSTDVIWFMINGETYREDLATEEEAINRYNDLKGLLLGTTVAELEQRINEQQQTITDLNHEIQTYDNSIDILTTDAIDINGENPLEQEEEVENNGR